MKELEDENLNEVEEINENEDVEMVELSEEDENEVGGGAASVKKHYISKTVNSKGIWLPFDDVKDNDLVEALEASFINDLLKKGIGVSIDRNKIFFTPMSKKGPYSLVHRFAYDGKQYKTHRVDLNIYFNY